jgi:hypothetical protein
MRISLRRFGMLAALLVGVAVAGINWKAVWLEPRTPVVLKVGEKQRYTVMGLNGGDVKADLTRSFYLTIRSSDPDVLEIDGEDAVFIGKKTGHAEIRISFSEATAIVQAFVKDPTTDSAAAKGGTDGRSR